MKRIYNVEKLFLSQKLDSFAATLENLKDIEHAIDGIEIRATGDEMDQVLPFLLLGKEVFIKVCFFFWHAT